MHEVNRGCCAQRKESAGLDQGAAVADANDQRRLGLHTADEVMGPFSVGHLSGSTVGQLGPGRQNGGGAAHQAGRWQRILIVPPAARAAVCRALAAGGAARQAGRWQHILILPPAARAAISRALAAGPGAGAGDLAGADLHATSSAPLRVYTLIRGLLRFCVHEP